jgi:hypothetical protein
LAASRVYDAYARKHDRPCRDHLLEWSLRPGSANFYVHDFVLEPDVTSVGAEQDRRIIAVRIRATTGLLCIVGRYTHSDPWVDWEVRSAVEQGLSVVAVRTEADNPTPPVLSSGTTTWATSFTPGDVKRAIDEAFDV